MAACANIARNVLTSRWRIRIGMCLDRVNAVAVSTCRGHLVAMRKSGPVNALHERAFHFGVALAACSRNIEFVYRRLCIVCRQNLVRTMAISTHGSLLRSVFRRAPVNTFLVADKRLRALAARLHQELLSMTSA